MTLFPASETRLSRPWYHPPTIKAAGRLFGIGRPQPRDQQVIYFSTSPTDYIRMLDGSSDAKLANRNKLAHQLGLTLDDHGTILGDRATWIGDHADLAVDQLVDRRVGRELLEMVP